MFICASRERDTQRLHTRLQKARSDEPHPVQRRVRRPGEVGRTTASQTASSRLMSGVPLFQTLRRYKREWIGGDLRGGLSAALVMIPSVIAYAQLAGLRPEYGLYAALIAMLGYALFTSSRQVIAGPDAALSLMVASAVAPLAHGDPAR